MKNILPYFFFFFGYTLNMFYISVLYHRGLTHRAVELGPFFKFLLQRTGVWITGLDPKTWACMHRIHHLHSDTSLDPHSPRNWGIWGVWKGQYKSYLGIQKELMAKNKTYTEIVQDITFDVSNIFFKNGSWFPYAMHLVIALGLYGFFDSFWVGAGYFLGLMSHPFQGWLVNAFAHKYGPRNFETDDDSTNNTFVGLFVFGEGYQNNHHRYPERAKFSVKWHEIDLGFALCLLSAKLGLLKFSMPESK